MKKSYFLTIAAVLAAAAVTVYAQLPKSGPPILPTDLPPIVADPNAPIPKPPPVPVPVPIAEVPKPKPAVGPAPISPAVPVIPASATAPPAAPTPLLPSVPPPALPPVANTPGAPGIPMISQPVPQPSATSVQPKLPPVPPPVTPTPPLTQVPPTVAPTPSVSPEPTAVKPIPNVPPPVPSTAVVKAPAAAAVPKQYVILKDDKLIEGAVKIDGEKVIVKQGALDRPYSKTDIQFIGNSKDEVYRFVVGKVAANDPTARMKVAKWCMFNGMRTHALLEAREVLRLDPKNAAATQMVRVLEESLQKFPEEGAPAATTSPNVPVNNPTGPSLPPVPPPQMKTPPPIPPAATSESKPPAAAVEPEPEVHPEVAALYPTRIQPILVNQCAGCHAKPEHASAFRLAKGTDFDPNPTLARPNLATVMKLVNKADPAKSPLLVKSLTAHGGMQQPAFASRNIPGYRILEAWTYAAAGSPSVPPPAAEPVAKANSLPPPPIESAASYRPPLPTPASSPLPPPSSQPTPVVVPLAAGTFGQEAKPLPAGPDPASTAEPADEFDPSVFNRSAHPGR